MNKFCEIGAYHLRLTTNKSFDDIEVFVKSLSDRYIISSEVGHYHCYVMTDVNRKVLRKEVNTKLGLKGNGEFSLAEVRKPQQMKKYILKDGFYRYSGYTENEIACLVKMSHKKGMDKLAEELLVFEEMYMNGEYSILWLCKKKLDLEIQYGVKPCRNRFMKYSDFWSLKKNESSKIEWLRMALNNYHDCV